MEAAHLIAFNIALLAALISPGPAMLMALRTTLVSGPRAGILIGVGLGVAAAGWTGLALLGLDIIFIMFPWFYVALKIAGAAYLLWLAISTWRNATAPLNADGKAAGQNAFVSGLLVNLANPKSVLFASAVLLMIFPPDISLTSKALIMLNHVVVESLAYAGFAIALSSRQARDGYLRLKPVFDRTVAMVLGALGLRLMLGR